MAPTGCKGWRVLVMAAAVSLLIPAVGSAADTDPTMEIGLLLGLGFADADLAANDFGDEMSPLGGMRIGWRFTEDFIWFGDATYGIYTHRLSSEDIRLWEPRTGVEWLFAGAKRYRWFGALAGGWMTGDIGDSGDSVSRAFCSLGIGQRFAAGAKGFFRWEVRADHSFGGSGFDGASITNAQALLGYSWGLGGQPLDADSDGVKDRKDDCPSTPRGAKVNEKGCPTDADGDGVFDGLDACPDTLKGWPVDARGCPRDTDGDGVPDGADACANTPKGARVDVKGCPTDSDGDSVPDGIDRCPDTLSSMKVDAAGCPEAPPMIAPLVVGKNLVLEGVNFESSSAKLTRGSTEILDKVAASLIKVPSVRVEVQGHTDSQASDAYNEELSQKRAEAVRDYLIKKGVDGSRLTAKGYGESQPIADNEAAEGRAKNRRVELKNID